MGYDVPPPPEDDVIVRVTMKNGDVLKSDPMPGVNADSERHAIEMHRERALNYEREAIPTWLPDGFDFSEVAEVDTEYRGAA